jgi:Rod binding domain-containing protein
VTTIVPSSLPTSGHTPAVDSAPPSLRILHAAREFEAILLANVLGPLERTFSELGGDSQTPGAEAYQSLGMQAFATALANHGGIGIGDMVAHSLMKRGSHV